MADLVALKAALARAGVTRPIERDAFIPQGFASVGDLENIKTLSQLLLTFKSIRYGGLLQPDNVPFSITASVSIEAFCFWINDRLKRNQSRTGADFNQSERDEFH